MCHGCPQAGGLPSLCIYGGGRVLGARVTGVRVIRNVEVLDSKGDDGMCGVTLKIPLAYMRYIFKPEYTQ